MSDGIVGVLETVQVDREHGDAVFLSAHVEQRIPQTFLEQQAVRKSGQRVVVCERSQVLTASPPFDRRGEKGCKQSHEVAIGVVESASAFIVEEDQYAVNS